MSEEKRLPIQVVLPRKTDYSAVTGGGGSKYLEPYTDELQNKIISQCINLQTTLQSSFQHFPLTPCVSKVIMKEKAIAKTHKPTSIFNSKTCPIVGAQKIDEVLISVTQEGLNRLLYVLENPSNEEIKKSMTKIQEIKTISIEEKIEIDNFDTLDSIQHPIKVRLFSFDDQAHNTYYCRGFELLLEQLGIKAVKLRYADNLSIYRLNCSDKTIIKSISEYPGVYKISFFPQYSYEAPHMTFANKYLDNLPMPKQGEEYPVIGIIDTGVVPGHKYLEPWIVKREAYVAENYRNYEHGTFVAGILEYGSILNMGCRHQHFKILDVVAFPNNNPKKGDVDVLSEDSLIEILYDVIGKYHKEVKVWNMSLGTKNICGDVISDFAIVLDDLQDKYDVDIVLPAGNYTEAPLRQWPPVNDLGEKDRITSPADSVRAISVGAIANIGIDGYVDKDMPAPFSRKGPGANFLIKPDVVHYGGNCTSDLCHKDTGLLSFDINGNLVEGVGTSYSAPAITAIYAGLRYNLAEDKSREFAKAFLIHSANIPKINHKLRLDHKKYYGYGLPSQNIEDILSCSKSSVTLAFSGVMVEKSFIEFNDFPYPKSLYKDDKCYGEIKMTLVYTPKLDSAFGQEYCRVNIDAHFGTYDGINEGKIVGFLGKVPMEKQWDEKYEKSQVESGFKWNPIKSYTRSIKNGIDAKQWRLMIDSFARLGDNYGGQNFVLFVTITDPDNNDIYTEVINSLREHGYIHSDIKVNNRIRQTLVV